MISSLLLALCLAGPGPVPLKAEIAVDAAAVEAEAPNAIGLSRHWERDPDDRNDDPALRFEWDAKVSLPPLSASAITLEVVR